MAVKIPKASVYTDDGQIFNGEVAISDGFVIIREGDRVYAYPERRIVAIEGEIDK